MNRILVLGAHGQVGQALTQLLGQRAIAWGRNVCDFSQYQKLDSILSEHFRKDFPDAVINAAAYTAVDQAEKEVTLNHAVNAEAPGVIARWCAQRSIPFVHYSTDYVFPGTHVRPWVETDATAPINSYGKAKREGEIAVERAGGNYLIFRTSWVYGAFGRNFFKTMIQLGMERETLKIVNDQIGAPTYSPHLARATLKGLENSLQQAPFPSGIYHLCGGGETSWHGFAGAIFDTARINGLSLKVKTIEAIPSEAYPTAARRPLNSRLNQDKARKKLGISMSDWKDGLTECMKEFLK